MSRNARCRRDRLVPRDRGAFGHPAADFEGPAALPIRIVPDGPGPDTDDRAESPAEAQARLRLLREDLGRLRDDRGRSARHAAAPAVEVGRLRDEAEALRAHVDRLEAGRADRPLNPMTHREGATHMNRIHQLARLARRNKAATAAVLAVGALVARDPAVSGAVRTAADAAASAVGRGDRAEDGYVAYARMVTAGDAYEAARAAYNATEAELSGDALLAAQDRLRAARLRDREARLAFLPALARRCREASVAVPEADAEALAALEAELVR